MHHDSYGQCTTRCPLSVVHFPGWSLGRFHCGFQSPELSKKGAFAHFLNSLLWFCLTLPENLLTGTRHFWKRAYLWPWQRHQLCFLSDQILCDSFGSGTSGVRCRIPETSALGTWQAAACCYFHLGMDQYLLIPFNTIFRGMNIHLPAILMWTTGVQGFDTLPFIFACSGLPFRSFKAFESGYPGTMMVRWWYDDARCWMSDHRMDWCLHAARATMVWWKWPVKYGGIGVLVLHWLHWLPECSASHALCICLYVVLEIARTFTSGCSYWMLLAGHEAGQRTAQKTALSVFVQKLSMSSMQRWTVKWGRLNRSLIQVDWGMRWCITSSFYHFSFVFRVNAFWE